MKSLKDVSKKIGRGLTALAIVGNLSGCGGNPPSRFVTTHSHMPYVLEQSRLFHKNYKSHGNDKDIDGDKMNDLYVVNNDGTAYHTMSRRLIQGEDSTEQLLWVENTEEAINNAQKGEYDSI